ncbi:MAG: type VI secretion system lipoprotein TssJ [Nitrosospira sp.]
MNPLSRLTGIISVTILLLLGGCASAPKPTIVKISLHAQPSINPDSNGRASPVVVKLYELKSAAAFDASDFFSIFDSEQKTLGAELLNSEVLQLRPGGNLEFDRPLNTDTRYLAAVAAFRDLEHSQWRATLALPPKEKISRVLIQLDGNRILIGADLECSFLCEITLQKPPPLGSVEKTTKPSTE